MRLEAKMNETFNERYMYVYKRFNENFYRTMSKNLNNMPTFKSLNIHVSHQFPPLMHETFPLAES